MACPRERERTLELFSYEKDPRGSGGDLSRSAKRSAGARFYFPTLPSIYVRLKVWRRAPRPTAQHARVPSRRVTIDRSRPAAALDPISSDAPSCLSSVFTQLTAKSFIGAQHGPVTSLGSLANSN